MPRKRVAIVGTGISGLTAAFFLQHHFDLTILEQNQYVGGHTNTVTVENDHGGSSGQSIAVDTGFIVYNDRTYPNFIKLLEHLQVPGQASEMSFSVRCDKSGIEYCGSSLNGLFAQRRNLLRPSFYRFLLDFRKFGKQALQEMERDVENVTVGDFFRTHSYGQAFYQRYFLPMGAAIWSCPQGIFEQFPIRFIAQFYHHHGLLGVKNRPEWRVVKGGSRQYVDRMLLQFGHLVQTGVCVHSVERLSDSHGGNGSQGNGSQGNGSQGNGSQGNGSQVEVKGLRMRPALASKGEAENSEESNTFVDRFDHVVLACHADQALKITEKTADKTEAEILAKFPYQANLATLHTDISVLPQRKRAWAAWNYRIPESNSVGQSNGAGRSNSAGQMGKDQARADSQDAATVTYNMNILQRLPQDQTAGKTYCVTLNDDQAIDPSKIIRQFNYAHPVFSLGRAEAQGSHDRLIDRSGLSYCGAYWGNGFHEDGVKSALKVCQKLLGVDPWKAVSTRAGSNTGGLNPNAIASDTKSS